MLSRRRPPDQRPTFQFLPTPANSRSARFCDFISGAPAVYETVADVSSASALVAVYVTEVHSPVARRVLRRQGSIPFTALHRLELRNSLELLVGRALLSSAERDGLVTQIQEDRHAGRLIEPDVDWQVILTIGNSSGGCTSPGDRRTV